MIFRTMAGIFLLACACLARGQAASLPATRATAEIPALYIEAVPNISENPVGFKLRFETPNAAPQSLGGEIHLHGAYSRNFSKKSYSLAFDKAIEPMGMRFSRQWILNAAFIDRSLMRHKLSYDLFLSLSTERAPRRAAASRFVDVYLNNQYRGVYLLMERVDSKLLGLGPSDPQQPEPACVYKAVNHDANFAKPGHSGFEQREPDPDTRIFWKPIDDLNNFVMTATVEEFWNPDKGIGARVDLDNAIDFHLLVLLTGNLDGITKNFLLSRDETINEEPKPKFFFAPWDYDGTFGRNWNATKTQTDFWLSNNLFDRLARDPVYQKRFQDRWKELREKQFSVRAIHEMIDANVALLGDAPSRNEKRWAAEDGRYPDKLSFEQDIAEIKQWVEQRVRYLNKRILSEN